MQRLRPFFLLVLLIAVLLSAWVFPPDAAARRDTQAGLQRAVATFAAARALHAVLSVAQGTQVAVQPAGVGLTLAPGQALQPVTELVEQFSTLMLFACLAFGVQMLLLPISAHWAVSLAVSVAAGAWVAMRWRAPSASARRLAPLVVGLLLLRFGIPLVAAGNELAYRAFLADDYVSAQSAIGGAAGTPDLLALPDGPADGASWLDRLRSLPAEAAALANKARQVASTASDIAAHAVDHLLRLLAVFALQTLVLPVLFLWALRRIFLLAFGELTGARPPR